MDILKMKFEMIFKNALLHMFKLEPVCCKKRQKKFMTTYWFVEYGISKASEWYKIVPKWLRGSLMLIWDQFDIIQNF